MCPELFLAVLDGDLSSGSNTLTAVGSPPPHNAFEDVHLNDLIADELLRYMSGGPNATQIKVSKNIPGPEYWLDHMPETISDALKHALIIDKKARAMFPRNGPWNTQGFRTSMLPIGSELWCRKFLDNMDIDTRQDGDFSPIAQCSYSGLFMDKRRQGGEGEASAPLFRLWRFRLLSRDILKRMLRFRRDRRNKGAQGDREIKSQGSI